MVGVKETATSTAGVGAGVGSTLLIRQQFDAANETSVLRPSVLWGVGTGLAGMAAPMVMGRRNNGTVTDFIEDYSAAALATGVASAFLTGGGVQLPSL